MSMKSAAFAVKASTVKSRVGGFHRHLMRNERLPPAELAALQNGLAQETVRTAMRESPYYRRTFSTLEIDPHALADPQTWTALPVLDRQTIKAHRTEFPTAQANARTARTALTGGSTGEPLQTMHDARVPKLALAWRMYSWWGIQPWDDLARFGRWNLGPKAALKNAVSWWPTRQIYLDAVKITDETMSRFHAEMMRVRPRLFEGYAGTLVEFADFLERSGLPAPQLTALASTAAPLTAPVRTRLEAVFDAPLYDEYRASELGWIAGECGEQDGLHVFADVLRVEVVDEEGLSVGPGEVGDIVITDLRNRVFPLIRYRTGDRGILRDAPCPCGRTLPLMESPRGRTNDVLYLPDGTALAHHLTVMFSEHPESVRLFQVHQHEDYSITVRVVEGEAPDSRAHIDTAVEALRTRTGGHLPVRLEMVDSLPYTGGKTKYILSDVVRD